MGSRKIIIMPMVCAAAIGLGCIPRAFGSSNGGVLSFETTSWDSQTMPGGCGNPFRDAHEFMEFYDAAISSLVAKRGPDARGVTELFAVDEMSSEIRGLFPNYVEESPIDRLVSTQLCQFQKVRAAQIKPGGSAKVEIISSDIDLQNHLVAVANKLYTDSRKLLVSAFSERAQEQKKAHYLASKKSDILKAREHGHKKIKDIFD